MTSVLDLITDAMINIGVLAVGETPSAAESALALRILNKMIDTWNTEDLLVYNIQPVTYDLVAGQASYTLGIGGDWDGFRPTQIERASILLTSPNPIERPIDIITYSEYAALPMKETLSTYPTSLYDDGNFPLKNISLYPVPTTPYQIILWAWGIISGFSQVSDQVVLPPAYQEFIEYTLSARLAMKFGKSVSVDIGAFAANARKRIEQINDIPRYVTLPDELTGKGRYFNMYTGQVR